MGIVKNHEKDPSILKNIIRSQHGWKMIFLGGACLFLGRAIFQHRLLNPSTSDEENGP